MRAFHALVDKEFGALFRAPVAWIVIGVFLGLMGYSFTLTLFNNRYATLVHIFFQAAGLLLLTAPVKESHVVLAKYLAGMSVVLLMIGLTASYAVVLGLYGTPEWGAIYSGYLGLALLASTLVSLGLAASALTSNQVIAAIVAIGISFFLWMVDTLAAMLPDGLERVFISLSLLARFTPFATGAMYTSDAGFFVSTTLLALFIAMRALARR